MDQAHPLCESRQIHSRIDDRVRIAIDSDQDAVRTAPFENKRRMPTLPEGAIKIDSAWFAPKPGHHFF
jgi:hypothetical protein